MQFYKIILKFECENEEKKYHVLNKKAMLMGMECQEYTERILDGKGYMFISSVTDRAMLMGMILKSVENTDYVKKIVDGFFSENDAQYEGIDIQETTFPILYLHLENARRDRYVDDEQEVLEALKIGDLNDARYTIGMDEKIIQNKTKKDVYSAAERQFTRDSLVEELDRIYAHNNCKKFCGHPVDYMIESDDVCSQTETVHIILEALYSARRIENRRYSIVELSGRCRPVKESINALYESAVGGTVVLKVQDMKIEDEGMLYENLELLEMFCCEARRHLRDVLTVICLPRQCQKIKKKIYDFYGEGTFVEIKDMVMYKDMVTKTFDRMAQDNNMESDQNLYRCIEAGRGYTVGDVNAIFDEWYVDKLRKSVYSQYGDIERVRRKAILEKTTGRAYQELNDMIGLSSAKQVINQVLDSYKAKKIFKSKGMPQDNSCRHMVFTGNPGTAKTTVARLFADIMKDNEILEIGQMIEVGRSELVGKYVGTTAQIVKRRFNEAKGGILFIDEAYSLVDDRSGSYGDEAINTIVQEMENNRDDVIVIFAGYPKKMERFLQTNPGLRSRIAYHVRFEDYNIDELCDIAKLLAKNKGFILSDGAILKIRTVMERAVQQSDFGNGRYVRNVIEKAINTQSSRLLRLDYDYVTAEDVRTITEEDIKIPEDNTENVRKIGFNVKLVDTDIN